MAAENSHAVAALFDPERLRLARLMAGLRKNQLAQTCGVSPSAITQYELGKARPRPAMVAQLALALGVPAGYLARDGRPRPRIDTSPAFFRSLTRTRQLDRDRAEAQVTAVWDLLEAIRMDVDIPEPHLPELPVAEGSSREEVERVAADVRQAWGIQGALPSVLALVEARGGVGARLPSAVASVDAFSKVVEGRPIIVLWSGKDNVRSRFDAAHELGHLVMHVDPEAGNATLEQQANAFASALLMPRELVEAHLPRSAPRARDWDDLFALKQRLGVSVAALIYRARTLGVMSEASHRRAVIAMSERGWRNSEPQDIDTSETPRLLHDAAALLARELGVHHDDLADRARLPRGLVEQLLAPPRTPLRL